MLSQGIGDEDTDASREGTAAHWVCEQVLTSFKAGAVGVRLILPFDLIGQSAPNGVIITEEIADGAKTYTDEVLGICQQRGLLQHLQIEQRVACPRVHELCWGTPDMSAFDAERWTLYVRDFKYGHGRVNAYENWQLLVYAIGLIDAMGVSTIEWGNIKINLGVIQPRCYDGAGPIDVWEITADDLRGYANQLHHAAHQALQPTADCATGKQCKHCKAAHRCPALLNASANIIDMMDIAVPTISSDAGLGYELEQLKRAELLLKARREAKELEVEQRIREGKQIPGWALEQAYGQRKWLAPLEEVVTMGQLMGVNLLDEPKLLSPAKADAACKKLQVDTTVISSYYGNPPTGMKLVFDDGGKAKQIFSNRSI
jgi:hypothetical protein